jgi:hypothetical protein
MRLTVILLMAAGIGAPASKTWKAEATGVHVCTVWMSGDAGLLPATYPFMARSVASRIYSGLGVRLYWRSADSCAGDPEMIRIGSVAPG